MLGAINSATKKWFWIAEINALSEVVFVLCAFEGEMKPKNGNQRTTPYIQTHPFGWM
jgi:hypothetical protein